MPSRSIRVLTSCAFAIALGAPLLAQSTASTRAGRAERIAVHGRALEGNLEGDSPDRDVAVYLPASYRTSGARRYPVVYMLHGFTDDIDHWWGVVKHFVNLPAAMNTAIENGSAKEMILVMPNAYTRYQGSMYSSSVTTGDWEEYVVHDLVAFVDTHYRTITTRDSRGIAGHSMGGYGALRIGMRHPDVFSSMYMMSACCLTPPGNFDPARAKRAEEVRAPEDVSRADFGTKVVLASAAAWSPNPNNPPLYLDLPTKDGQAVPNVIARWTANAPLALIDQNVTNLRRMHAIGFDVGTKDGLAPASKTLDELLTAYKIPHKYETYDGDHLNRIQERLETIVFKFFSENLTFR